MIAYFIVTLLPFLSTGMPILPRNPRCAFHEMESGRGRLIGYKLECTTEEVYPAADCYIASLKDGANDTEVEKVTGTEIPNPFGGETKTFRYKCERVYELSEMGTGNFVVIVKMYPRVLRGEFIDTLIDVELQIFVEKQCNSKCIDNECNNHSGDCIHGCEAGYKMPKCTQTCDNGTYGESCEQICNRNCLVGCNIMTGECEHGCYDGYELPNCDQKCVSGTFGPACSKTCGEECKNNDCNPMSGACKCEEGAKTPYCLHNETEATGWSFEISSTRLIWFVASVAVLFPIVLYILVGPLLKTGAGTAGIEAEEEEASQKFVEMSQSDTTIESFDDISSSTVSLESESSISTYTSAESMK